MQNNQKQTNQFNNYDEEISFNDMIQTLVNSKKIFFLITFLLTFSGVLFSFQIPKTFESTAFIEIGRVAPYYSKDIDENSFQGPYKFIEPIDLTINETKIYFRFNYPEKNISLSINKGRFIKVVNSSNSLELGKELVNKSVAFIISRHQELISQLINKKTNQILLLNKKINLLAIDSNNISTSFQPSSEEALLSFLKLIDLQFMQTNLIEERDSLYDELESLELKDQSESKLIGKVSSNEVNKGKKVYFVIASFFAGLLLSVLIIITIDYKRFIAAKGVKNLN